MSYEEEQARKTVIATIKIYPSLLSEVEDLFQLMMDEIEDGNSPTHEYELFESSVEDLTKELKEK